MRRPTPGRVTVLLAVAASSCGGPAPHEPPAGVPSPARMARVAGGYELANANLRVVVSDQTGDVLFFGPDAAHNLVPAGIAVRSAGSPDSAPSGTIEARDDQTWQFLGTDADRVTWRKTYCLQDDALLVSVLVANGQSTPLAVTVQLRGDAAGFQPQQHDPEHLLATSPRHFLSLVGYNEVHAPDEWLPAGQLLRSDRFQLKPGERRGYTTRWQLRPLNG